ncbi:hypothetical protein LR948_05965 [Roseivivax sp. GX 12232]|uniref:hypothetical protein n=1 Tax=Roseivivax sp. GX 12232 TaxID=2900547 RepID=UPI001E5469E0|nr:hypothetical protein [Roseivivax sp. GX 12232]MCE0504888.1 hypothetical protein [Roseivivax sp. GX 12232]
MTIDEQELAKQIGGNTSAAAGTVYQIFARANLPCALSSQFGGHGYIDRELRFVRGERWYFAAVLNKSWVLWYFRRPAISDLNLSIEDLIQTFPGAEVTTGAEVKIRVENPVLAYAIIGWVFQAL